MSARHSCFVIRSSFVIRASSLKAFIEHGNFASNSAFPTGSSHAYIDPMSLNLEILSRAADQARGLAMDAVQASKSGHLGLPLGCAEMGAVLYGHALKHNPDKPRWIGRDYFILSAGHGSMFL